MKSPALQLIDVRKRFGRSEIIRGVSLSIPSITITPRPAPAPE